MCNIQADFSLLLMRKIRVLVYNMQPASGEHRQMLALQILDGYIESNQYVAQEDYNFQL